MLGVDLCVKSIIMNLDQNVLYMIAEITGLEIPLHVKLINQSGKNTPRIAIIKLNQKSEEYYKGLEKHNLGIHKEDNQTHRVMIIIMKNLHQLPTILALPDITVLKLPVPHVLL